MKTLSKLALATAALIGIGTGLESYMAAAKRRSNIDFVKHRLEVQRSQEGKYDPVTNIPTKEGLYTLAMDKNSGILTIRKRDDPQSCGGVQYFISPGHEISAGTERAFESANGSIDCIVSLQPEATTASQIDEVDKILQKAIGRYIGN